MAGYEINVGAEVLPGHLNRPNGLESLVLQATVMAEAMLRLTAFIERFARIAPKSVTCLEDGFEDAMAVSPAGEVPQTAAQHAHAGGAE